MRHAPPWLIRVFAALLLLQSGAAMGLCMRGAASGWLVEICAPGGEMRTLRLAADGTELPAETGGAFCPICHGLPEALQPPSPLIAGRAHLVAAASWWPEDARPSAWRARAPPFLSRAPPSFLG